jgi:plastocyanin
MGWRGLVAVVIGLLLIGAVGWRAALMSPVTLAAPAHHEMLDQGAGNDDPTCDDDHSGPGGGDDCPGEDHSGSGKGWAVDAPAPAAPGAAPVAADGATVVHIVGRSFSPASIAVAAGQAVTFINDDGDTHTATGSGFDTGAIPPGGSVSVVPAGSGSLAYQCAIHPEMAGTVVVPGTAGAAAPGSQPSPAVPAPPPSAPGVVTVEIADFTFTPAQLTVTAGTEVVWTNGGRSPHTVSGDFGDSGTLTTDQSFRFTFNEEGTFDYLCQFHPNMIGSVVVQGDAASAAPSGSSSALPNTSLVGVLTLIIAVLTMVRDLLQP